MVDYRSFRVDARGDLRERERACDRVGIGVIVDQYAELLYAFENSVKSIRRPLRFCLLEVVQRGACDKRRWIHDGVGPQLFELIFAERIDRSDDHKNVWLPLLDHAQRLGVRVGVRTENHNDLEIRREQLGDDLLLCDVTDVRVKILVTQRLDPFRVLVDDGKHPAALCEFLGDEKADAA